MANRAQRRRKGYTESMKTTVDLDAAEKEAIALFEAKKAEGAVIEARMRADKEAHQQIVQDMTRLQGAYEAIQNLKKQAGVKPPINSPAPKEEKPK